MITKLAIWLFRKANKPVKGLRCDDFTVTDRGGNKMFVTMCWEVKPGVYELKVWTDEKRKDVMS